MLHKLIGEAWRDHRRSEESPRETPEKVVVGRRAIVPLKGFLAQKQYLLC
jgi:hypothetical protein